MNNKTLLSIFKKIAKYEILWLFLYLAFSLAILIIFIASVLGNNTTVVINGGFIVLDILSIFILILYLLSLYYLDNKKIINRWTFYVGIFLLIINLIALPILAHYLKIEYPLYKEMGILNFDPNLSATLWLTFIFSGATFILSIIIIAFTYKEAHPFNPPVQKSNDMEK